MTPSTPERRNDRHRKYQDSSFWQQQDKSPFAADVSPVKEASGQQKTGLTPQLLQLDWQEESERGVEVTAQTLLSKCEFRALFKQQKQLF